MYTREYYVYIMTNRHNKVLYTGVTNHLIRRVYQHRSGTGGRFTSKYRVTKLVYFENFASIDRAIRREKQIKAGSRDKKIELINSQNPDWRDLYEELY